jgi:acyl-coenzyme A thioesterase PaaI-like protein
MKRRVLAKQPNSAMCLVCGLENAAGLHAAFYELDNEELLAVFCPRPEHQGYPGRLHGGLAATILDETIGRAIMIPEKEQFWGVSVEIRTRFRKPVPLGEEIRVLGRVTRNGRLYTGTGEILLPDGTVAVEGEGKYLKMPIEKISDLHLLDQWKVVLSPDDRDEFEL